MKSGTQKSLIAGVGLVALGTIALSQAKKRRSATGQAADIADDLAYEAGDTAGELGQSVEEMPEVMEMPAAGDTRRAEMDPAIE